MSKFNFTKIVASGNDFVVTEDCCNVKTSQRSKSLARKICDRKYGAGADGLLVLEKSKLADVRMRVFNADGSEAEMCGNGARCVAFYLSRGRKNKRISIQTKAGILESQVSSDNVKIRLTQPKGLKLGISLRINNRPLRVNYIDTGVPHTVVFVERVDSIDVKGIGRRIRFYNKFAPRGTNVDFVEVINKNRIKVRTYERGVEDETLACGTGSVAAALISGLCLSSDGNSGMEVSTKSGEILKVYFRKEANKFSDIWLEGKAKIVYWGAFPLPNRS